METIVRVKSTGKTGVEMEALVGVSIALLTVWDMVKSAEKDDAGQYPVTCIQNIRVVEKRKST
jgi:cyclic pyranopterin phosphate synthase